MVEATASFHFSTQRSSPLLVMRAYLIRYSKYESLPPPHVYSASSARSQHSNCTSNVRYACSSTSQLSD